MLKKLLLIVTALSLIFLVPLPYLASAKTAEYRRVITDDTPFYSDESGQNTLFFLPYTYYVKVLGESGEFLHVECYGQGQTPALDGFVPKDALYNDGLEVSLPYLNLTIKTYENTVFYADSALTTSLQYVFPERTLAYYGKATTPNGETVYYVAYNGRLGYVKESAVYPFTIDDHPNELTFIVKEETPQPPTSDTLPSDEEVVTPSTNTDFFSVKVIIVICLGFAGLIAIFLAIKPKLKKVSATSYYDENDYE